MPEGPNHHYFPTRRAKASLHRHAGEALSFTARRLSLANRGAVFLEQIPGIRCGRARNAENGFFNPRGVVAPPWGIGVTHARRSARGPHALGNYPSGIHPTARVPVAPNGKSNGGPEVVRATRDAFPGRALPEFFTSTRDFAVSAFLNYFLLRKCENSILVPTPVFEFERRRRLRRQLITLPLEAPSVRCRKLIESLRLLLAQVTSTQRHACLDGAGMPPCVASSARLRWMIPRHRVDAVGENMSVSARRAWRRRQSPSDSPGTPCTIH